MPIMNPHPLRLTCVLVVLLASVVVARAEENRLGEILKQREHVLAEILAGRERRYATGVGDGEAVHAAQLALWSFRRDTAATTAGRIAQQELIVGAWEKRLAAMQNRAKAGLGDPEAILLVTDEVLQARQRLEELRGAKPAG